MVSSGATGMGKRLLRTKSRMSMSIAEVTEQVGGGVSGNLSSLAEEEEEEHHRHHVHHRSVGSSNGGEGGHCYQGMMIYPS